jgi:7-cyano-7-deazaguanine synthase
MTKKAIILFSGGLDSTTCLAIAKAQGFELYALSFHYGQKHNVELEAAKQIVKKMNVVEHKIVSLHALGELDGSSLTDNSIVIPDYQDDQTEIPSTYVPARNTIFLSIALGWGEILGAFDIFYGANDIDYSGYPDCRPEYLLAFENLANFATKAGIEGKRTTIHAPLLRMTKKQVIQEGHRLGVDYSVTISCYRVDAQGRACGRCDSCTYRKKGFTEAMLPDPTKYI